MHNIFVFAQCTAKVEGHYESVFRNITITISHAGKLGRTTHGPIEMLSALRPTQHPFMFFAKIHMK